MEITGKVGIITGGAGGIGVSIIKKLLDNGIKHIALFELDRPESKKIFHDLEKEYGERVSFYVTDVTKTEQLRENFDKFIEKHQTIDILINSAGIISDNTPERMMDINYKGLVMGTLLMIERVGKHKGGKGGVVVNMASILGLKNIVLPVYCSTKHAVVSFTRTMDFQVDVTGVRVVAICPGVTDTNLLLDIPKTLEFIDPVKHSIELEHQKPEYVAAAVAEIIEKGKSGDIWVAENSLPPYAVRDIDDYPTLKIE